MYIVSTAAGLYEKRTAARGESQAGIVRERDDALCGDRACLMEGCHGAGTPQAVLAERYTPLLAANVLTLRHPLRGGWGAMGLGEGGETSPCVRTTHSLLGSRTSILKPF